MLRLLGIALSAFRAHYANRGYVEVSLKQVVFLLSWISRSVHDHYFLRDRTRGKVWIKYEISFKNATSSRCHKSS